MFIATPGQWRQHGMAARQAAFIVSHLHSLQAALAEKGIPLHVEQAEDFAASVKRLASFCGQQQVTHLFYNYQYEINERQRDAAVENTLAGVTCQGFDDSVLLPPGSVLTGNREMYKVFTPFKNAFLRRLQEALPECVAAPKVRASGPIAAASNVEIDYPQTPLIASCSPRMKKALSPGSAVSASKKPPIMNSSAIFPPSKEPAGCRRAWRWARSRRASACTVCWLSSRGRWMAKPGQYGSTSLSGASFTVI